VGDEEALAAIGRRDPRAIARWDAFEERFPSIWDRLQVHDVRAFLGIRAFGVAAFTASAGDPLIVPHNEAAEGYDQEELYAVVEGRARFVCDGQEVELDPGTLLYASPEVHREGYALASRPPCSWSAASRGRRTSRRPSTWTPRLSSARGRGSAAACGRRC
jgi:hypothetical protein